MTTPVKVAVSVFCGWACALVATYWLKLQLGTVRTPQGERLIGAAEMSWNGLVEQLNAANYRPGAAATLRRYRLALVTYVLISLGGLAVLAMIDW